MLSHNPLFESISNWFRRTFADPAAISLFMTLVLGLLVLEIFGSMLLPVLISIVIAYLLQSVVRLLERWRCPHWLAVTLVFLIFVGLVVYALVDLLPLLWSQLANLVNELPGALDQGEKWLSQMTQHYPRIFSDTHLQQVVVVIKNESSKIGQEALKFSLATIPSLVEIVLYLVLVPLLIFFFLKDSQPIIRWFERYLPTNRGLVSQVWSEVNEKIGCYVRGRVVEILIVGSISSLAFALLGLQYAVLLGVLVGLSVIVPYVGAVVVTIPIVIISLMEWGFSAHFAYLMATYAVIITLDANVLVPLLFSETMDLHPIVIILAVIFFGDIWGFWGVFFAIPLATLVNAVLKAWPKDDSRQPIET